MKAVIINGQNHKGSTYHLAHLLTDKLQCEVEEFFMPKDLKDFCLGCATCVKIGEDKCPHHAQVEPIVRAMDEADLIILASPVYVYHATAPMKNFLDHLAYRWGAHRPEGKMYKKQGVCISTAAGAGMKSTNKDMADSLDFWGLARVYKCGVAVAAIDWDGVSEKKKTQIDKALTKLAKKIKSREGKVTPSFKAKFNFSIMRMVQAKWPWNPIDVDYWKDKGWLGKERPWKQ